MTIESAGPTAPAQPVAAAPRKSFLQRMAGALFSPAETFEDIARKPDIVAPLLVLLAIGIITTVLTVPRFDLDAAFAQQAEMMKKQNPHISDADLERIERFTKPMMKVGFYVGPVLMVAFWAVIALMLFGAFRLMGGEGTYKQSFSVTLYAWMPMAVLSIVAMIIILARGTVDPMEMPTLVKSSLGFLVDIKEQPVAFALLSSIDVFSLWTVALLAVGFAAVSTFSRAKSAAIVITLWFVLVVIKVGVSALQAARMSG